MQSVDSTNRTSFESILHSVASLLNFFTHTPYPNRPSPAVDYLFGAVSGRAYCALPSISLSHRSRLVQLRLDMPRDPLIGLVGKPSSGKSTTLNRCDGTSISATCSSRLTLYAA